MITVKMCRYSVPVRFIHRKVTVRLTCDDLTVNNGRREIARHWRRTGAAEPNTSCWTTTWKPC